MKVISSICAGILVFCFLLVMPVKTTADSEPNKTPPKNSGGGGFNPSQTNSDKATGNQYNINNLNLNPLHDTADKDLAYRNQLSKFVAEGNTIHARLFKDRSDQAKVDVEAWVNSVAQYLEKERPYLAPLFLASATSTKAYANTSMEHSRLIVGMEIRLERLRDYIMK